MNDYRDEYRKEWNAELRGRKVVPETASEAWQELLDKDDRNSPEDYPEMCLIKFEELQDFMSRSRGVSAGSVAPSLQGLVSDDDWNRALGCAYSCLEAPSISLADFDNAMQHAFGMLSLRRLSHS